MEQVQQFVIVQLQHVAANAKIELASAIVKLTLYYYKSHVQNYVCMCVCYMYEFECVCVMHAYIDCMYMCAWYYDVCVCVCVCVCVYKHTC